MERIPLVLEEIVTIVATISAGFVLKKGGKE